MYQNAILSLVHAGAQQCFVVFDVLMVNDTNLANCPLRERAEQLKKCVSLLSYHCSFSVLSLFKLFRIFQPIKGCIHLVDRQEASAK